MSVDELAEYEDKKLKMRKVGGTAGWRVMYAWRKQDRLGDGVRRRAHVRCWCPRMVRATPLWSLGRSLLTGLQGACRPPAKGTSPLWQAPSLCCTWPP